MLPIYKLIAAVLLFLLVVAIVVRAVLFGPMIFHKDKGETEILSVSDRL